MANYKVVIRVKQVPPDTHHEAKLDLIVRDAFNFAGMENQVVDITITKTR